MEVQVQVQTQGRAPIEWIESSIRPLQCDQTSGQRSACSTSTGPGASGRTYQYLGCKEMTGRDGLGCSPRVEHGEARIRIDVPPSPARVEQMPVRVPVPTHPHK